MFEVEEFVRSTRRRYRQEISERKIREMQETRTPAKQPI